MFVQIITPEETIFEGEVDSIAVPGKNGEFHMLKNHMPIVSTLVEGLVKIHTHTLDHFEFNEVTSKLEVMADDDKVMTYKISGGVVEMNHNKVIILAE